MYNIDLKEGRHNWQKQNLVTVMDGKRGHYDIMKCYGCGMIGERHNLSTIRLKGSYSKEKIFNCPGNPKPETNKGVEYIVVISPWPGILKVGTKIISVAPRENSTGEWFKKSDGSLLFEDEKDGKFCLRENEVKLLTTSLTTEGK